MAIGVAVAATGTDVEIVSGIACFLSSLGDESSEVAFVRTLVGRKTHVAVDAIGTILGGKPHHIGVVGSYFLDDFLYQLVEACLTFEELILVGIEPLAIVVGLQSAQKGDDIFHIS